MESKVKLNKDSVQQHCFLAYGQTLGMNESRYTSQPLHIRMIQSQSCNLF